jgi:hypothetical protein
MSIETLLDLSDVSVEELIRHLKASEERHDLGGASGSMAKLNLTEGELVARVVSRLQLGGNGSALGSGHGRGHGRGHRKGHSGGRPPNTGYSDNNDVNRPISRDRCKYCGKKRHWARKCRKKKREKAAHLAQAEERKEPMLMLATTEFNASTSSQTPPPPASSLAPARSTPIHVDENKHFIQLSDGRKGESARWILDMGGCHQPHDGRAVSLLRARHRHPQHRQVQ